jgi:predicted transcriptional regulator
VSCDLSEDEIDVLYWFYSKHLLSERANLHEEAVYRRLGSKVPRVREVVKSLRTKGYIGKHKTMCLYAAAGPTIKALQAHRPFFLPSYLRL